MERLTPGKELRLMGLIHDLPQAADFITEILTGQSDGIICWRAEAVERRTGSEIEGVGLFATGDIPASTVIAIKQGGVVDNRTIKDNAAVINGSHQQTADYSVSQVSNTHRMFMCQCGSKQCRGIIQPGWDWQNPDFQARYAGEFPEYVQTMIDEYNAETPEERRNRELRFDGVLRMADMVALSKRELDSIEIPLAAALAEGPPILRPVVKKLFFNSFTKAGKNLQAMHDAYDRATEYFATICPFGNIEDAGVNRLQPETMTSEQREEVAKLALNIDRYFN